MNRFRLNTIYNFIIGLVVVVIIFFAAGLIIQSQVKQSMVDGKLNDLMNFIDTKYVHILDFLHREKQTVSLLSQNVLVQTASQDPSDENLARLNNYLASIHKSSILQEHSQKKEKESGKDLKEVFGREVKWDIYRLNERLYRYDEILVINNSAKVVASSREKSVGESLASDDFYVKGKDKVFIKDVYRDYTGNVVMGFSSPIVRNGQKLGVLAVKVDADYLNDLITGDLGNQVGGKLFFAGLGEFLDLYIVNKDGLMITQSKRLKGKKDTVLKQKVNTLPVQRAGDVSSPVREAQEVYENFLGEQVAGASMTEFGLGWSIIAEQTVDDAFKTIYGGINILFYGGLFGIIVVFVLAILFSRFMWSAVRKSSNQVISAASQLFDSSKQTTDASKQSASIAYELASGATEQSKQAEFVSKTTTEMARAVQQMSTSAKEASETAENTAKMAENARSLGKKSQESLAEIKKIISGTAEEITTMADKSKKIEEIVEAINNIASKTHILALNAAIEASRAGEAGGGFAIIADQVRELAASSSNSAKEVKDQIGKIVAQIKDAVMAFSEGVNTADKSSEVINETLASLQNIASDIQKVSAMIINVSAGIQQQSSAVQEVATNMDSIAAVAEQNASGSRQLSTSIEQLSSTNEHVAAAAEQLHALASNLQKIAGGVSMLGQKIEQQNSDSKVVNN